MWGRREVVGVVVMGVRGVGARRGLAGVVQQAGRGNAKSKAMVRFIEAAKRTTLVDPAKEWKARVDNKTGKTFWYNTVTFESSDEKPTMNVASFKRPTYATDWADERFPDWVQFLETSSRRHYYLNRATGHVQWLPPGTDMEGRDVFLEEIERERNMLSSVPADVPSAPVLRRLGAFGVDLFISAAAGFAFAGAVWFELGRPNDAIPAIPFAAWAAFLLRDSVFEGGTRSLGKRLMKLEIVRWNGKLPTRRHTLLRQAYLPVYAASTMLLPYIALLPVVDLGLVLFTPRAVRIGDVLAFTKVIPEQPDRARRLKEKQDYEAAENLKE